MVDEKVPPLIESMRKLEPLFLRLSAAQVDDTAKMEQQWKEAQFLMNSWIELGNRLQVKNYVTITAAVFLVDVLIRDFEEAMRHGT